MVFIYNAKVRQLLRSAGRQITDYTTLFTDSLSAYLTLLFRIVPVSHNRNSSYGILQFFPLPGADVEVECTQVFLQMRQFCCSRNRYDPRCFLKQPAKSHLCRGHAPCATESLQRIYNADIRTHRFRLETLRTLGISWIAAGAERIDLPQAMELLHEHFGVERLAIVGGGHICGSFLEAGLIDEVSIMVAPGIDGRKGQTAVFDGISRMECNPYKLKLESVEQWETDIVWLRYKVK
mgnify:CR=1 FL=1